MKESFNDILISLQVYKENYKAFIAVFIVVIIGLILSLTITLFLLYGLIWAENAISFEPIIEIILIVLILLFIVMVFLVFIAFKSTLYGLSYDIMSSGDLFTKFTHSFSYFRRYWWQYAIISVIFAIPIFIGQVISFIIILNQGIDPSIGLFKIGLYIVEFFSLVFLVEIYPSITAQGRFLQSISENIRIVKLNFRRILISISIYFLLFRIIIILGDLARLILVTNVEQLLIFNMIFLVIAIADGIIGTPVLSIITTRIYNTTELE
ncbi:MAG: hypothetical protein ACFFCZ_28230 [Promethearchaeota archaeon]